MFFKKISLFIILCCIVTSVFANYSAEVDFSKPSTEKRFFIYKDQYLIYSTWVTHGSGSGGLYATYFSNSFGSHASSLGLYKTIGISYSGKHGRIILLEGLSNSNSNVSARAIEIHSAGYIGHGNTGRSWGCLAVPYEAMPVLLRLIPSGIYINVHN